MWSSELATRGLTLSAEESQGQAVKREGRSEGECTGAARALRDAVRAWGDRAEVPEHPGTAPWRQGQLLHTGIVCLMAPPQRVAVSPLPCQLPVTDL